MEAPTCQACRTKHWSRQPCPARKEKIARMATAAIAKAQTATKAATAAAVQKLSSATSPVKQRWDRKAYNEYQRKLMRERRARLKKRARSSRKA